MEPTPGTRHDGHMSQFTPESSSGRQITRFLRGYAIIQGAVLAAIVLALVFDVITIQQMVPLTIAVAMIGGLVMVWRIMSLRRNTGQQRPGGVHQTPEGDSDSPGTVPPGLDGLGQKDPMARFRDPNR